MLHNYVIGNNFEHILNTICIQESAFSHLAFRIQNTYNYINT